MSEPIRCPNGCDPDDLEREDWGAFKAPGWNYVEPEWIPPSAIYTCHACQWEAIWVQGQGLKTLFVGAGRE